MQHPECLRELMYARNPQDPRSNWSARDSSIDQQELSLTLTSKSVKEPLLASIRLIAESFAVRAPSIPTRVLVRLTIRYDRKCAGLLGLWRRGHFSSPFFFNPRWWVLAHSLGVQVRADRAAESTHPAPELRYAACSILAIRCCSACFQRTCLCRGRIAHICRNASCLAVNGSTYGASADVSLDP
jgi:hypothetical protein